MPERGIKTSTVPVVWAISGIFWCDPNNFLSGAIVHHGRNLVISLWSGDKATINALAALLLSPLQKIPSSKIRWKSFRLEFFGIKTASSSFIINAEYYSFLLVQLKDILKNKRCAKYTKEALFLYDNDPTQRHLQLRRKCPTWASNALITRQSVNAVYGYNRSLYPC